MILNMFWFELINFDVNWISRQLNRWADQIKSRIKILILIIKRLKKVQLKFFAENVLNHKTFVYVFYIRSKLNELCNIHLKQRARVITMNVSKKTIFKCFKKFENLKNEDKAYKLSEHEFINYVIELKKDKSSSYNFIYFLSESELKIFKKYLNKHLKNDFIRFF